jgi:tripartite-type tricarboxylate transporter receptor subunit TctC
MNKGVRLAAPLAAIICIVASAALVRAQYPAKTITYIIAFAPGGESDISARLQEPFFEKYGGETVAIQYRAGAGGAAAWSQLNRMPADGYTIVGTNIPHVLLQPMQRNVGYETEDISTVYWFHYTPNALVVTSDSPFETLDDLVVAAKKAPSATTSSGSGTNGANHLAQQRFDALAGITTTYIPFRGTGGANTAILGKQVAAGWTYTTGALQLGDKARVLAVATEERHPKFPDVPTFKELGYDLVGGAYRGIAVPKSTPSPIKRSLSDLIGRINRDPEFIQKMEDNGFAMIDVDLAGMPEFMDRTSRRYEALAIQMGIKTR